LLFPLFLLLLLLALPVKALFAGLMATFAFPVAAAYLSYRAIASFASDFYVGHNGSSFSNRTVTRRYVSMIPPTLMP